MKEFITAARQATTDEDKVLEFKVDGEVCKAYRPGDGQIAMLMATTQSRHLSEAEQMAGIINFFVEVLDEDSHHLVVSKLLDRRDEFGIAEVQDIIRWMMEEWSGRPTQSSSGSTPSPQSGGPTSTPPTPQSTSSDSPATAS